MYAQIVLLAALFTVRDAQSAPQPAPRLVIDLDLPPRERFNEVCTKYRQYVPAMEKALAAKIPAKYVHAAERVAASIEKYIHQPFADEMRGIALNWNISLGQVILSNLYYEWTAFCTSIVSQTSTGTIIHGRNLDYRAVDLLRNLTMILDFQRAGVTVYSGASFAGYIGLMTGQSPDRFTVSVDERNQGYWWENVFEAIFSRRAKTIGFFVRELLSDGGNDFHDAVEKLTDAVLIAPVYFIVGGTAPGEGAVITRGREILKDVWYLDATEGRWYLVETNYDHWTPPPPGDDRRHPAEEAMNSTGQGRISPESLFRVLSVHPVLNNGTAYTTIMSAATPELFNTWVRHP